MLHKNISYQNTNIHYSIYGSGKPVMLLHGFAEDSSIFDAQVNYLKENYLVIVPDLPGIGKSEMLKKENVELADYAAILKAIIDEEKINSFTLNRADPLADKQSGNFGETRLRRHGDGRRSHDVFGGYGHDGFPAQAGALRRSLWPRLPVHTQSASCERPR